MGKRYQVLARRYRPQRFADVMGQDAVLTTLKNALRFDQAAHAYLFCGSRGVGKTTLARLFAKALNCPHRGADLEPCNQCPSCIEITSGQSLDVMEIDGASNRGIDDIRQINETVGYAPSHGKFKIYIIDEVHMLTKEAFNALLKTLEEPPQRAKFFFATTEPHKVLPTIISRCQRFDLLRISAEQIGSKLAQIARDMHRETEAEALHLIASFADGSLRDAESLFDQILCFASSDSIRAETVRQALGLIPQEHFFDLDRAFSECRLAYAFELVEILFQAGKDLSHFLEQLVEHYRRLCLCKTLGEKSLPPHFCDRYTATAKLYTQSQCLYILDTLIAAEQTMQKSPFPRVTLESTLLHIIRSKNRIPIEVIAKRLIELEQTLEPVAKPPPQVEKEPPQEDVSNPSPTPELKPVPFHPFASLDQPAQAPVLEKETPRAVDDIPPTAPYYAPLGGVNLDSARQSQIEGSVAPGLKNVSNLPARSITEIPPAAPAQAPSVFATTETPAVLEELLVPRAPSVFVAVEAPRAPSAALAETPARTSSLFAAAESLLSAPPSPAREPPRALATQPARAPSAFAPPPLAPVETPAPTRTPSPSTTPPEMPKAFVVQNVSKETPVPTHQKHPSHYETLMRFAAVELEGTLKI